MAECRKRCSVLAILFTLNFILEVGNASIRLKADVDQHHVHMFQNLMANHPPEVQKRSLRHHSIVKRDAFDPGCQKQDNTLAERRKNEKDFLIVVSIDIIIKFV